MSYYWLMVFAWKPTRENLKFNFIYFDQVHENSACPLLLCLVFSSSFFPQSLRLTTMWPVWSQRAPCSSASASSWVRWFGVQTRHRHSSWPQQCSSSTCYLKSSLTRATPCQTSSSSATWGASWSMRSSGPAGTLPAWGCRCGGVTREEPWVREALTLFHSSKPPATTHAWHTYVEVTVKLELELRLRTIRFFATALWYEWRESRSRLAKAVLFIVVPKFHSP